MIRVSDKYELILQDRVEEISATAYLLHHKKSGAKLLLLETEDDNKVFSVTFKTTPENSTGVPHIMEHSVLCGSDKYPLKDPFVELCKGSLNTFLNAVTWPDKTSYPTASRNAADFRNLMSVYMDAAFRPNIYKTRNILKQEGWHYELDSEDGELTINGVVYNEMRGSYSNPDTILEHALTKNLYPGTTYEVVSGGDPECIPDLTYEEFIAFHKRYYHPSNSYIFLYGDMDFEERLAWLDEAYLKEYDAIDPKTEVGLAKHFDAPKDVHTYYNVAAGEEENNSVFLFAAGMDEIFDPVEVKAMEVLSYALLNAPGAPIKKALLKEGIGADVYGGYDSGYRQPNFSVISKGSDPKNYERFKELVRETVRESVTKGIPKKTLRAGINNFEFSLREADYGRMPKGLVYNFAVADTWLHDEKKALVHLKFNETFRKLKELVDTDYFEDLAKKRILENPYAVTVLMEAKSGLSEEGDRKLAEKLAAYKASLKPEEIRKLIDDTKALKAYQEAPETKEALESIPLLKLSDVDQDPKPLKNEAGSFEGIPLVYHRIPTSGIGYLEARFPLTALNEEELHLASLLRELYTQVDTDAHSYQELGDEIAFETGGIGANTNVYATLAEPDRPNTDLAVTARYLFDHTEGTVGLMKEVFGHSSFEDTDRIKEILDGLVSSGQEGLVSSGHVTAGRTLFAGQRKGPWLDDELNGLGCFRYFADLKNHFEERKGTLAAKLKVVEEKIFTKQGMVLSYTGDEKGLELLKKALPVWISELREQAFPAVEIPFTPSKENVGIRTSSMVQYTAMGGNFRLHGFPYSGAFRVFSTLMHYEYLWSNIRVKGGAYGCMTKITRNGDFALLSYRDPHLKNTLSVYRGVADYMEKLELDDREMLKYILGTISNEDAPMQPAQEGSTALSAWLSGLTDEEIARTRHEILNCTVEDLRNLAPAIRNVIDENRYVTVGGEGKIEENRNLFDAVETLQGERQ